MLHPDTMLWSGCTLHCPHSGRQKRRVRHGRQDRLAEGDQPACHTARSLRLSKRAQKGQCAVWLTSTGGQMLFRHPDFGCFWRKMLRTQGSFGSTRRSAVESPARRIPRSHGPVPSERPLHAASRASWRFSEDL